MTQAIHKVWMAKPSEAWYQLSQEERTQLSSQVEEKLIAVGGRHVIICDARWASEQYHFFGVDEYPTLEALQQFHAFLVEINWLRYVDSITTIGTKLA